MQDRAERFLAGGIGSSARGTKAGYSAPLFVDRAEGATVTGVDGREYIDFLLALGPLIHGHRPPRLRSAVMAALDRYGSMVGLNTELEAQAAEVVVSALPSAELVRFSNSGTEAVMMAYRIARAVTGRPIVVRFEGHYHGWSDIAHWSVKPSESDAGPADAPRPVAAARGIPKIVAEVTIVLPWNNEAALEKVMTERGDEIAAVITEPLMANVGCVEPKPGFLARIRELTLKNGSLLIFDEAVTGFRLSLGGAQQLYGVNPDLTVLAKAMGGGYAVSAVAGTRAAMEIVARQELPYLGTYNTNPLCMAAVIETVKWLREAGVYTRLDELGRRLSSGLRDEFKAAGLPAVVRGPGTVFQVWFTDKPAFTYRDAIAQGKPSFFRLFHEAMLARGVLFHPDQYEHFFVSTAHTFAMVDRTLEAAKAAIGEIAQRFT